MTTTRADPRLGGLRALYDGALPPDTVVHTLRHVDRLLPSRRVARGATVLPLPPAPRPLGALQFESAGRRLDLMDVLALNRVSALLVLKNGAVAYEQYALGQTASARWTSMSMVKSISSTLVGVAVHDGAIRSLDDDITRYLPALRGSAYEGVDIRQLLWMNSGVAWDETYTDPGSDRRRMLDAQIAQQPGEIMRLMAALPRAAAPGQRWNYSTGETHVVGALLRAALGRPVAQYLSQRIWANVGMEADARWWLESPRGLEVGGSGLVARLRDFARFGLFMLADGVVRGERVLPEGWAAEASRAQQVGGQSVPYGYMWWLMPPEAGEEHAGAYRAHGIFGQHLYLNPREQVVIAQFSALSKPKDLVPIDHLDFFGAVVRALR